MKISILNGNPATVDQPFEDYVEHLIQRLNLAGHAVNHFRLREMDIHYCTGCFGCWVKTPGECVAKDASEAVCRSVINSDFTLWAAPLRMGFPSAMLKKMMDKSIPLIHPYFVIDHNEAHHRARYDHYPRLGLLLARETTTTDGDISIVSDIFSRTALNMKSRLEFVQTSDSPVEDVASAIESGNSPDVAFQKKPQPTAGEKVIPPTRLTVFNGSPRGPKGNTPLMLQQIARGFTSAGVNCEDMLHLFRVNNADLFRQAFSQAECVLLGFPLYTDAMPGIVKTFIETLEPLCGQPGNPPIGFLVQSGFPESSHSRHVEHYLRNLASRLGSPYLGTIVKGSGEAVSLMPEKANRKLFTSLEQIGQSLAAQGCFDLAAMRNIAGVEKLPTYLTPVYKLLCKTALLSFYWDWQLKENGAFHKRFARPYLAG